jgi:hypothetical protein
MCLVETIGREPRRRTKKSGRAMIVAQDASRSDSAVERHATVAVGFSPRTREGEEMCRVATPDHSPTNHSAVATRRNRSLGPNRGLKPTATITSSLCDEEFAYRLHPQPLLTFVTLSLSSPLIYLSTITSL